MCSKFTAMGRLPILSTVGTPARSDDQAQDMSVACQPVETRGRQRRHVQFELSVGLCLCISILIVFVL